jgi:ribosomal protein S18 acetylase RimI-like enzyme
MPPELFEALAATWPAAETIRLGPFTLRRGAGGGNRTSAATLDGPPGDIAGAEAAMRAWGQRPLFQLRPGDDELDRLLDARGYRLHDPSVLYAAPAAALAAPAGLDAIPCDAPLACMAEIWAADGVGPARVAVMRRASAPRAWLLGRLDDRPVGCAFVAVAGGVAMLSALVVAPEARRRGLAARMMRGAAAWAAAEGAATFGLAVTRENVSARALYESLGMAEAARYHYRIAPEETR